MAALALVGACSQYPEITTPVQTVTFTSAQAKASAISFTESQVRTLKKTEGRKDPAPEITGASCSLVGTGFQAKVTTPAKLSLPRYVGAADPLDVRCQAQSATAALKVQPINETLTAMRASTGGGLIGAAMKGISIAVRDPSKDKFVYPNSIFVNIPDAP